MIKNQARETGYVNTVKIKNRLKRPKILPGPVF